MTIIVVELSRTCRACPSQWEGKTDDDRQVYVRYRWGYLSVTIAQVGDDAEFAAVRGKEIHGAQLGDGSHGYLSYADLIEHTRGVIQWPAQCN